MNVEVIQCSFDDISFIPILFKKQLGYARFAKRKKPEVWFKAVKKNSDYIVGAGCLLILSKSTARLSNIFVLPKYRGQKVMHEIVKKREEWAKENSFKYVDVRTVKRYYQDNNYSKIKHCWFIKEL